MATKQTIGRRGVNGANRRDKNDADSQASNGTIRMKLIPLSTVRNGSPGEMVVNRPSQLADVLGACGVDVCGDHATGNCQNQDCVKPHLGFVDRQMPCEAFSIGGCPMGHLCDKQHRFVLSHADVIKALHEPPMVQQATQEKLDRVAYAITQQVRLMNAMLVHSHGLYVPSLAKFEIMPKDIKALPTSKPKAFYSQAAKQQDEELRVAKQQLAERESEVNDMKRRLAELERMMTSMSSRNVQNPIPLSANYNVATPPPTSSLSMVNLPQVPVSNHYTPLSKSEEKTPIKSRNVVNSTVPKPAKSGPEISKVTAPEPSLATDIPVVTNDDFDIPRSADWNVVVEEEQARLANEPRNLDDLATDV